VLLDGPGNVAVNIHIKSKTWRICLTSWSTWVHRKTQVKTWYIAIFLPNSFGL